MFKGYYRLANIITLIIAMLIASTLFIFTINQVSKIYAENTHQSIYDLKKSYLYDNVNNFILNIDTRLEIAENNQEVEINQVISFFNLLDTSNEALYEQIFESYYEDLSVKNFYDVILWKNDNIIYQTDETVTTINEDLYSVIQYGENSVYTFVMAVDHDKIESIIKDQLYEQIHASVYQYEAYIWVNEVINYDGGDNYAIRRVHPNAEEGVYLSTSMTDIKGNFPYLEELEGVKEDGDIFFTYYFKKLSTDEISEKLTYAKLYERFDWIIAMGIYIDETDAYIASVNQLSKDLALYFVLLFIIILALITISTNLTSQYFRNRMFEEEKRILQNRINFDKLTGVLSRSAAEDILNIRFEQFKKDGHTPILMLFDIDNFKEINDSYGHECGDRYLRSIAQNVKAWVRERDLVFRYGGDEFIILYDGLKLENAESVANNLIRNVHLVEEFCNNESSQVSISVGISMFRENDQDFKEALNRADKALYEAKKNGKNQLKLFSEE
ncbi:MAG: sensor domain-containing diguanylate cyclase [Acholeplasmataceae bacterium]